MADVIFDPTEVQPVGSIPTFSGFVGEAVIAGWVGFLNPTTRLWMRSQNNGTLAESQVDGMFLNDASLNQPITVAASGQVDMGPSATIVQGQWYLVSNNLGRIFPVQDLLATQRSSLVGVGRANNIIELIPFPSFEDFTP